MNKSDLINNLTLTKIINPNARCNRSNDEQFFG